MNSRQAALELVTVAKLMMAHELPRILAVLKHSRIKVDGAREDESGAWLRFGDEDEAKAAVKVLRPEGFDARVHTFSRNTVRVEYE